MTDHTGEIHERGYDASFRSVSSRFGRNVKSENDLPRLLHHRVIELTKLITHRTINKSSRAVVKYWEIIADRLSKAGWSWGWVSAINSNWQTIFIVDAHRDDGRRFIVHADEKLTAFLELESAIRGRGE